LQTNYKLSITDKEKSIFYMLVFLMDYFTYNKMNQIKLKPNDYEQISGLNILRSITQTTKENSKSMKI